MTTVHTESQPSYIQDTTIEPSSTISMINENEHEPVPIEVHSEQLNIESQLDVCNDESTLLPQILVSFILHSIHSKVYT
jgi:hypothetical protein